MHSPGSDGQNITVRKGCGPKVPQKPGAFALAALAGVPFAMVLGNSMIIPVLPDIKSALNLTQFEVSMIITLFSVPAGIIIPLAGFLSDRYGRKIVIIPGLILYAAGGIVAGLATILFSQYAYQVILGGRIIQGIGAAGTAPIAMALTGDLFIGKARSKSLGIIEAANGAGKVVSPILGAAVGLIIWFAPFLFFPAIIVPIVISMWLLVKEPEANRNKQKVGEYIKSVGKVFEKKSAMLLTSFFVGMVSLLVLFGVLFFLSDYLEATYGLDGIIKGAALAIPVLFMAVTSFTTGALIKKKVKLMKWLVVIGLALISGSLAMLGIVQNTYLFFGAISVAGVGTGLVLPCLNTIITSAVATQRRGMVTSLYGSVRFFGVAAGPPAFGLLMEADLRLMFWAAAGLAGVAALSAIFLIRVKDMVKPGEHPGQEPAKEPVKKQPWDLTATPAFILAPARKPEPPEDKPKT